jgi:tetratricopeptide (TPR) repeat protein
VLQSRADEKREQGLDDEATELLEEAKELAMTVVVARPKSALAKVVLANTLFRLRSDDKEIEDTFDKAEKDDPGFAEGYALHAYVDYFMKRYEKAVERNQRALRENPDLPIVHSNLGYSYLKLGRFDEALRSFEEAQRRDPFWSDWAGLGEALLGKENYRRAIAQLKRASEKRWCDTRTRLLMAKAYLGSGDPETALKVARKAVKDSTAYAEAYQLIAQAQAQLDHEIEAAASYEEAIRLLKEGQTIDEGDGAASIYLDYAEMIQDSDAPKLQKMKRAERVLRDGITANQERPKQVAILQTALGIALSAQGRDGEAEREFLAATQADPKNRGALVSLADVQERLERNRIH